MNVKCLLFACLIGLSAAVSSYAQWSESYSGNPAQQYDVPYIYYVHVVDSNNIWAVLGRGYDNFSTNRFIRTGDGGKSWQKGTIPDNDTLGYTVNVFARDSLTAWAVRNTLPEGKSFVHKTTDGGVNWTEVSLPLFGDSVVMIALHFFDSLNGFAYAEAHNGVDWHIKVYYTMDGGETWQSANTPYLAGERIFIWHGNNNYAVQGDTVWFGTSLSRIFRSVNKGKNWEAISVPFHHIRMVESVVFLDSKNGIAATALSDSLGGTLGLNDAYRTEDGGDTWTRIPIPNGLWTDPRMMGLCAIPGSDGAYMLYGYWQNGLEYKQMVSKDHGMTWYYVDGPETKIRCMQFISPTKGWGGGWAYHYGDTPQQTTIIEKMYKWSGPALLGGVVSADNEWNRLQLALQLAPNPATEVVNLQIRDSDDKNYRVEIIDMKGKRYFFEDLKSNSLRTLSIQSWPSGAYVVKVSGSRGIVARTLLKQ